MKMRKNHLCLYKQPYSPTACLCDWKAVHACKNGWILWNWLHHAKKSKAWPKVIFCIWLDTTVLRAMSACHTGTSVCIPYYSQIPLQSHRHFKNTSRSTPPVSNCNFQTLSRFHFQIFAFSFPWRYLWVKIWKYNLEFLEIAVQDRRWGARKCF